MPRSQTGPGASGRPSARPMPYGILPSMICIMSGVACQRVRRGKREGWWKAVVETCGVEARLLDTASARCEPFPRTDTFSLARDLCQVVPQVPQVVLHPPLE